jgi:sulfite reductase alpha subunit-like flavoprotein
LGSAAPACVEPEPIDTYSKQQPWLAPVLENRLLSGPGSTKETRQVVFDLSGGGFTYQPGDALGVWPRNCPALVIEAAGTDAARWPGPGRAQGARTDAAGRGPGRHLEIARVTAAAEVFSQSAERCAICCRTKPAVKDWLWTVQLADVLREYPRRLPLETWLTLLKPLQPRLYSISSSLAAHPGRCT